MRGAPHSPDRLAADGRGAAHRILRGLLAAVGAAAVALFLAGVVYMLAQLAG